jgi:hypothetical protein
VAERRLHTPRMIGMHRIEAWVDQYRAGDEPADLAEDFRVDEPVLRAAIEGYELGELAERARRDAAIREALERLAFVPAKELCGCGECEAHIEAAESTLRAALGEG